MQTQGMLTVEELAELSHTGQIDTVLCMFTDMQGRFMGKRILPDFFLEEVLGAEGLHACLYLLAVDMEMEPLPGYAYASWDTGYGDFRMIPDITTLRQCPWLEKTAMVICDIADEETSEPTAVAPRQILKNQIAGAAEMGYLVKTGSELEFYLFKDSFDALAERDYREARPSSSYIMDYHMLQTTKDEWFIRQVRNGMRGAGIPVEFSKGEFGKGQHEINITFSDALSNADNHALYKHGAKEIAALNDVAVTFMAKWTMAEAGSSCHVHSSVWSADGTSSLMWADDGPQHMSDTYRWYLGGLMTTAREMSWMYAPFVNSYKRYQLASWAPTAIVWSRDNRTAGYRTVGEHKGARVECRLPGADANPYLAFAATIASGMWGIRNRVEPPAMFSGNAYEAKDIPRVPTSLHEAIEAFRGSAVAREVFGDFVFEHLLNTAEQEQIIFDNQVVTDWELRATSNADNGVSDDALWAIIRSVPGWEHGELEVAPLEGGITNRNYVVSRGGDRFVLRVPGRDTELLGIDRANEARAATLAAEAGVGPEVVAVLPDSGCFVARFVEGAHVPMVDLRRDDVLGSVVRSLRSFHACAPIPSSFNVFRIVEGLGETAEARGAALPAAYAEAHALANRIEAGLAVNPAPLTTCHNDLLNANLLRDGDHTWIVDYEYAGMGDPFFDLGNLAVNNDLDAEADELLLRLAAGEVRDRHRARLALMRLMSDFREAMWGVVQQAISTLDEDFVAYAAKHFDRLLANAAAAPLDDLLTAAGEPT